MLRFFKNVSQLYKSQETYRRALKLTQQGEKKEALELFTKLVKQYPYDVPLRRQVLLLSKALGEEIQLPMIYDSSTSSEIEKKYPIEVAPKDLDTLLTPPENKFSGPKIY